MKGDKLIESMIVFFIFGIVLAYIFQVLVTQGIYLDELITTDTPLWEYQTFIIVVCECAGILVGLT
jgi:hypothetical protein